MDLTDYDEVYSAYEEAKTNLQSYEDQLLDLKEEAEYEKMAINDATEKLEVLRINYSEVLETKNEAESEKEEYEGYLNDLENGV